MKTKLIAVALLAGSSMFAANRFSNESAGAFQHRAQVPVRTNNFRNGSFAEDRFESRPIVRDDDRLRDFDRDRDGDRGGFERGHDRDRDFHNEFRTR